VETAVLSIFPHNHLVPKWLAANISQRQCSRCKQSRIVITSLWPEELPLEDYTPHPRQLILTLARSYCSRTGLTASFVRRRDLSLPCTLPHGQYRAFLLGNINIRPAILVPDPVVEWRNRQSKLMMAVAGKVAENVVTDKEQLCPTCRKELVGAAIAQGKGTRYGDLVWVKEPGEELKSWVEERAGRAKSYTHAFFNYWFDPPVAVYGRMAIATGPGKVSGGNGVRIEYGEGVHLFWRAEDEK
jgi:putative hemolysin